jgi:hypothetical protein
MGEIILQGGIGAICLGVMIRVLVLNGKQTEKTLNFLSAERTARDAERADERADRKAERESFVHTINDISEKVGDKLANLCNRVEHCPVNQTNRKEQ